jgi:hypothetical protein
VHLNLRELSTERRGGGGRVTQRILFRCTIGSPSDGGRAGQGRREEKSITQQRGGGGGKGKPNHL